MNIQEGKVLGIARKTEPRAAMEELEVAEIGVEFGLDKDWRGRRSDSKLDRRQISVMTIEAWEAACAEVDHNLAWTVRRANILVDRLVLKKTLGATIQIGDVVLRVTEETEPCSRMDEQVDGLTSALTPDWRGGVCCVVEHGGAVNLGDTVILKASDD